ncbi:MAG: thioesterase family protein [Desulfobacteraceae bacterium]|nr:MAG: thioesterase family protein [Desulfobacteraceae bacterium]
MKKQQEFNDILGIVHEITEKIPFNQVLGLTVESLDLDLPSVRLTMQKQLIGNFIRGSLHGGVISSTLDFMGGLVAFLGVLKTMQGQPLPVMAERFARIGTIDLRVDYLRPGIGRHFIATGYVLRTGKKVSVTRMELHNDERQLIAVGTGAYTVA